MGALGAIDVTLTSSRKLEAFLEFDRLVTPSHAIIPSIKQAFLQEFLRKCQRFSNVPDAFADATLVKIKTATKSFPSVEKCCKCEYIYGRECWLVLTSTSTNR
ncbi:hypothetical protein Y032_0075g985 [Ancylostoma ceylanicum]|uniref:Uncharacterized protein n=1 Tax=Ancylostoma ceylanicum TaxID=53326 RepID=A0A016TW92_9BILA|nr:hypothetical protein Y032_0075g985 [Ancylostoma ceylanicum]